MHVFLVHEYTGHGNSYFYFSRHKAQGWQVVATVVSENGRFVVDDVRIFDSDSTGGPLAPAVGCFCRLRGAALDWTGRREKVALSLSAISLYGRVFPCRTSLRTATDCARSFLINGFPPKWVLGAAFPKADNQAGWPLFRHLLLPPQHQNRE